MRIPVLCAAESNKKLANSAPLWTKHRTQSYSMTRTKEPPLLQQIKKHMNR